MRKDQTPRSIAIFGAGGFGLEVAGLIQHINAAEPTWHLIGFFDDGKPTGTRINDWMVIGGLNELNAWKEPLAVVFALGIPKTKTAVVSRLDNTNLWHPTLMHPSVIIGSDKHVQVGDGSIVCAGTIITTNIQIGRHVILNLGCTVGHETHIGDYSSFMPACNISGEVTIGESTFWGTGAKIINAKIVGDHATIGAGAVVINHIPDHATAVGIPAKVVKQRINNAISIQQTLSHSTG